ncbi:Hsp70 family protein [Dethiobacter alkaliphilus]|uniref:Hsp70 family protein n=1 Tax=Dethiobacter alkaliphilus TaxID=427926 RepID=UPI00222629F4|nr:Hsp70 family protein [Dethiobacter alkaliphilus]MCW3488690.1 Hsp70 family protein [Dethiobacter alkaliphilus]
MGHKIGIDLGTTNSTVAFVNTSNTLEAFRYPGPSGYEYIPSCVAYEEDGSISIGRAALNKAGEAGVIFCDNFKMILPLSKDEREQYPWTKVKKPEEVVGDYLTYVLTDKSNSGFASQKGKIESIVLSVPHVWAKAMDHAGRSRLQNVIVGGLKLPLIQLISEPVAAAAYYAYKLQQEKAEPFRGNLLVCDMGGGTFDVTLCEVTPGKVEELYNDGNGRTGLGKAGVFFDGKLILDKDTKVKEGSAEFYKRYKTLQEYKVDEHDRITKNLITAIEDPDRRQQMPVLRFDGLSFDYDSIMSSFAEVNESINKVLKRFKTAIDKRGYSVDAIFFVGGFAQFYLVREAIKKFWNIGQNDSRFIEKVNEEIARYAIAYGAALVANGLMAVEEKYEHTIGIEGFRLDKVKGTETYEQKQLLIPIIRGGKKLSEYEMIHFAENPVKAHNENPEVSIYVDESSRGCPVVKKLPEKLGIKLPNADSPGNQWKVGMRINRSKIVYLVFEDMNGKRVQYELGDLLRQLFSGLEVLEEGKDA